MARGSSRSRGFRRRWGGDEHSPYESGIPVAGCKCATCEAERTAQHYENVGKAAGLDTNDDESNDTKGGTR